MKKNLLKEENMIISCIQLYGPLKIQQLVKYLSHKDPEVAVRIIKGLFKSRYVYINEDGYVSLLPFQKPDDDIVKAFWAFLKFSPAIKEGFHYRCSYPSQIFFLKDNNQYEISVIKKGDEATVHFLKQKNLMCEHEEDKIKFILVVDDLDSFKKCASLVEDMKVAFAIFDYSNGDIPHIDWKTNG